VGAGAPTPRDVEVEKSNISRLISRAPRPAAKETRLARNPRHGASRRALAIGDAPTPRSPRPGTSAKMSENLLLKVAQRADSSISEAARPPASSYIDEITKIARNQAQKRVDHTRNVSGEACQQAITQMLRRQYRVPNGPPQGGPPSPPEQQYISCGHVDILFHLRRDVFRPVWTTNH